jgi:predicted DNA-binding ribbon-helix-helix protein
MQNNSNDSKVRKTIYLDQQFFNELEDLAEKDGRSFNSYVIKILKTDPALPL